MTDYSKIEVVLMETDDYEPRYRIINKETGEVIDDAQGAGFKSKRKAYAAYKWKKTRSERNFLNKQLKRWDKAHSEVKKLYHDLLETWFKEIARGEVTFEECLDEALNSNKVSIDEEKFSKKQLMNYLDKH